jgi:hypothetical protein
MEIINDLESSCRFIALNNFLILWNMSDFYSLHTFIAFDNFLISGE